MKNVIVCFLVLIYSFGNSQSINFPDHFKKTMIAKLQSGDSLTYYQCHVDSASQELTTASGQKIKAKKKKITITEKFVVFKKDSVYSCKYYTSSITNYPNKKFPYLTLMEVKNWEFETKGIRLLTSDEVLMMAAIETKTHSITHYQLNINKTCPNELIIKSSKNVEQFIVEGNYILSKNLKGL